jgi:hypothetical protein
MLLGAAYALLVKDWGSPQLAEELLRKELAAERLPWGALRVKGPAPGSEFWRSAPINYSESRAGGIYFSSPAAAPICLGLLNAMEFGYRART